ncbi:EF-hand domain-containing protein [Chachezhania antarctica]|uniref:EF-hand domain-containing protein n=1 Tax=Chachezhania antarctica TaxID=2340860 RepID=UPI0013CEAF0B|nr:EF-hand domain-containing protein [Chachezhania antarctica]
MTKMTLGKPALAVLALGVGVLAAGSALAFGPSRGAAPEPGFMEISFAEIDIDGDGEISFEELRSMGTARMQAIDTDNSGGLSLEEMQAAAVARASDRAAGMFERMDRNGDAEVTADELPKPRRTGMMFDRMDRDSSGTISEEEFAEAKTHMQERMKKGHHGKDSRHGKPGPDDTPKDQ